MRGGAAAGVIGWIARPVYREVRQQTWSNCKNTTHSGINFIFLVIINLQGINTYWKLVFNFIFFGP